LKTTGAAEPKIKPKIKPETTRHATEQLRPDENEPASKTSCKSCYTDRACI